MRRFLRRAFLAEGRREETAVGAALEDAASVSVQQKSSDVMLLGREEDIVVVKV